MSNDYVFICKNSIKMTVIEFFQAGKSDTPNRIALADNRRFLIRVSRNHIAPIKTSYLSDIKFALDTRRSKEIFFPNYFLFTNIKSKGKNE